MAPFHPTGIIIEIVGLNAADRGRSCEELTVCGAEVLKINSVVRFRAEQINVNGTEETALAVYWVTDGVDQCKVGFLPRHLIKHKDNYDGKTAQIVEFLETLTCPSARAKSLRNCGIARAALLEGPVPKAAAATVNNVEDPGIIYIERTQRTPTKKRTKSPTKKKDSAKIRLLTESI
jgi:hypothetical protein